VVHEAMAMVTGTWGSRLPREGKRTTRRSYRFVSVEERWVGPELGWEEKWASVLDWAARERKS
jgi:hypothetical protein